MSHINPSPAVPSLPLFSAISFLTRSSRVPDCSGDLAYLARTFCKGGEAREAVRELNVSIEAASGTRHGDLRRCYP